MFKQVIANVVILIFNAYYWISGVNECISDPCENGGTCNDDINGYNCECRRGYNGNNCEISE